MKAKNAQYKKTQPTAVVSLLNAVNPSNKRIHPDLSTHREESG